MNLAHAKPAEGYVPFVTDFPRAEEPYVPFVTDFPRPATPSDAPGPAADGIDWAAVGLEGGVGAALAALLASSALVLARRRQPRTAPSC